MEINGASGIQSHLTGSIKNLAGTVVYFFCQWLMTIIVVRLAGYTVSGEYTLAISFTNLFGFFSQFSIRNLQLSDVRCRFSPQQYTGAYIIINIAATIFFIGILLFCGYSTNIILYCLIYMLYRLCETLTIYTFTYMQLEGNFSGIFISYCLKGILPLIVFSAFLYFNLGLLLSLCVMPLLHIMIILVYDFKNIRKSYFHSVMLHGTSRILKQCFPVMLSTLTLPFMLFLTRHTVEKIYGTTELGYYSVFSMVIVIFSTMASSIYVVFLPVISEKYMKRQLGYIIRAILYIIGAIFAVMLIAILLSRLIGNWAFSFVFGIDILPYMYLLLPVIVTSTMLTIVTFLSTCLTAMHKRVPMLIGMLAGAVILSVLVVPATRSGGILGTTNIFTLSLAVVVVILGIIVLQNFISIKLKNC
jgi:O-antigen/teichoic acid export membrane protein